ncbi:aldo/keto reductase [Rhodoferax saidenbachensis]|uniref:Aldo/keto reductase n=1 Tax=Rhodoferax saidenbachensis TaxID=1484693 RepID=A0A1P8KBJ7_9BURK|nr:aldo/keto reductase [Rhodoferax saidenbachensis]APW43392.1 aldo/keto reductase [Rhodoferax saidenbachensis]
MNITSPATHTVETIELTRGYRIPRIIRGGWQLAGDHGEVNRERALTDMAAFVAVGLNTVDGADIYTGVEAMYGEFNARQRVANTSRLQVHTKFVPDYGDLAHVDEAYVRRIVTRSLQRLQVEQLDLVQFHWWDYQTGDFVAVAQTLNTLRKEGLIAHLGGTNFDTASTQAMLQADVPLVSMQVQYSLLDRRPAHTLAGLGARHGMHLLCYGTLAGGFLSERWLNQSEPNTDLGNRSLVKYKLIIEEFGGWAAFQTLLRALKSIADRHGVSISTVATRWVLDQPAVAAAIVGARYGDHIGDALNVFTLKLDSADHALLGPILATSPGPGGDTYSLERDKTGPHGRIMKYDLNKT